MLRILSKNRILFAAYLLISFSSFFFLIHFGKKETHLLLTSYHSAFQDHLMQFFTLFGDGLFMVILGLLLFFRKIKYGFIIVSSFLASSIFVQLLKRFVFEDCKRPAAWFHELGIEIYRIGGVEYHSAFSFPSGHTTTAFALFFGLAFFVKNTGIKILFLLMAIITGFSRIYLSQHFLGDVLAGSVLGIFSALAMEAMFEKSKALWMEESIITIIRKKNAKY
jgi:membrane-associated phospholipid phosphatase